MKPAADRGRPASARLRARDHEPDQSCPPQVHRLDNPPGTSADASGGLPLTRCCRPSIRSSPEKDATAVSAARSGHGALADRRCQCYAVAGRVLPPGSDMAANAGVPVRALRRCSMTIRTSRRLAQPANSACSRMTTRPADRHRVALRDTVGSARQTKWQPLHFESRQAAEQRTASPQDTVHLCSPSPSGHSSVATYPIDVLTGASGSLRGASLLAGW